MKYFLQYIYISYETTTHCYKAMSSINIPDIMERHIKNICSEYLDVAIRQLGNKYSFEPEKAIAELDLPTFKRTEQQNNRKKAENPQKKKKTPHEVPAIPLPFCGVIMENWCQAIVKNNKLFTQCTNLKKEQGNLCNKCQKICEKNGALPFGEINNREHLEIQPISYAIVMKKLNITQETAINEAAKFGWNIDQQQFNTPEKTRGRPKKIEDEESTDNDKKAPAKRGRPKKEKPTKASSQIGDDIIAGLLQQANNKALEDDEEEEKMTQNEETEETEETSQSENSKTEETSQSENSKEKTDKKKTDKEAQKAAAKAAKEAEKAAAKAAKEAEKAAAKAANEAEKAAKKKNKKDDDKTTTQKQNTQMNKKQSQEKESESESESEQEETQQIKVKKFEFNGKLYKLSQHDNILYDWDNDEPVGIWNPNNKTISPIPDDESDNESDEQ